MKDVKAGDGLPGVKDLPGAQSVWAATCVFDPACDVINVVLEVRGGRETPQTRGMEMCST
jgi:hypothetical protein